MENCIFSKMKPSCEDLNCVIKSIACQEAALAELICAESDKIKKIVDVSCDIGQILKVNESAQSVMQDVISMEVVLANKLKQVLSSECQGHSHHECSYYTPCHDSKCCHECECCGSLINVKGTVCDMLGNRLPDASVCLSGYKACTNLRGEYCFKNIRVTDSFEIYACKKGARSITKTYCVKTDGCYVVDFILNTCHKSRI